MSKARARRRQRRTKEKKGGKDGFSLLLGSPFTSLLD
jgi:hypothetical protein